jgi:segregation and condensation protein A
VTEDRKPEQVEQEQSVAQAPQHEMTAKPARKKDALESASPFSVVVGQVYEGPLDLLLDLIRKQDIDIYDIPIARITAQFLSYVENLKQTDVDAAGEFIYTAALLIHIKSRMLLPRSPAEAGEAESEDPRRELVERLLEHERFKNAAQMLKQKQQIEEATWTRPAFREFQDEGDEREIAADTVDLVRVFREVLERVKQRPVLNVDDESVTVGQMIDYLRRRLTLEDAPVRLSQMLRNARSERAVICMFLALLELVRLQAILLRQERNFGEILIKKHTGFEQVMNDTLAARDDWR